MNNTELINHMNFNLSSVAHCRLGREWNYQNVLSSFTRLYLITEGEAFVYIGHRQIKLRKGYLYLIPSFINCSYACHDTMEQYYATFTIDLPNNLSIYQLFNFRNEVKAEACHYEFFRRLCDENKGMALPAGDPKDYQKRLKMEGKYSRNAKSTMLTSGLLHLLVSEFIGSTRLDLETEAHNRISASIIFIHQHHNEALSIEQLASDASMSADHYTRKFKELSGQTPLDYINRQRIERAQHLIVTSSLSISEIAFHCGFVSNSYFSKVFKKYVNQSPRDYKHKNTFSNELNSVHLL